MSQNTKQPARGTQPDYYRILGVDGNASPEEIAEAYRALVLQCHPDLNPGDPQAEARFLAVQAAFEVLSNRVKRTAYDRTRGPYRTYVPSKIDPLAWHVQLYPLKAKQPQWFQPNQRNLRTLVLYRARVNMAQIGVDEKGKFGEHTQVDWEGGRVWKNEVQGCAALSSRRQRSTQSPGNDITILTHVFSGEWKYCG